MKGLNSIIWTEYCALVDKLVLSGKFRRLIFFLARQLLNSALPLRDWLRNIPDKSNIKQWDLKRYTTRQDQTMIYGLISSLAKARPPLPLFNGNRPQFYDLIESLLHFWSFIFYQDIILLWWRSRLVALSRVLFTQRDRKERTEARELSPAVSYDGWQFLVLRLKL